MNIGLRSEVAGRGSFMHTPGIENLRDVYGLDTRGQKSTKRVPVMAPVGLRIRIGIQFEGLRAVDHAEMGDVARVREQHRVPVGLEVRLAKARADKLVLVTIEKRRPLMPLNDAGHDSSALWIEIVGKVHRENVSILGMLQAETHAPRFQDSSQEGTSSWASQKTPGLALPVCVVEENPFERDALGCSSTLSTKARKYSGRVYSIPGHERQHGCSVSLALNGIEASPDLSAMCHPSLIRALRGITYTLLLPVPEVLGPYD